MVSNMQHTMGNMHGETESKDNRMVVDALVKELKAQNMKLAGDWRDGVGKESMYIRTSQVNYMRSLDDPRHSDNIPQLTGVDCYCQGRSQRNAVCYGSTVAPHGGWLTTNMTLFTAVHVSCENIRVTDQFGWDFQADTIFHSLKDFPMLLDMNYLMTEVLGTQLYFTMVALTMLAQRSHKETFVKEDRLRVAYFALMVLTSYKMHIFTFRNCVASVVSLTFGLATEGVTKPWRLATLSGLEGFFGLLRTLSNTNQPTVMQMAYATEKVT